MLVINNLRSLRRVRKDRIRGISLLEVLISILLSAIGLLALSGANVASIRYSKMSQYRGTASVLALDLAERMRANKGGLVSYKYTVTDWATQTAADPGTDTSCEGMAANCTAANLAAYDLATWRRVVRQQLPEGSVFINVVDAAGNAACLAGACMAADVWLAWRDPAVADADENSTDSRNNAADVAKECPAGLSLGADKAIRCSFFRINL